jgi:hypothetical protein
MAWTAPKTWTVGEILTAANMNAQVRDNLLETGPALVTTKGDLLVAAGLNNLDRVAVGANERQLVADSAETTGVRWTARHLWFKGADIASAATLPVPVDGNYAHVTGTVGVTAIATLQAGAIVIYAFDAALTITHNATTLVLESGANYTTGAGDVLAFISEGAGNWRQLPGKLKVAHSIILDATGLRLSGDAAAPGNNQVYGTTGAGVKGWKADPGGALDAAAKSFINDNLAKAFYALGPAATPNITTSDVRVGLGFASRIDTTGTLEPSTVMRGGWRLTSSDPGGAALRTSNVLGAAEDWIITARVRVSDASLRFSVGLGTAFPDPSQSNDYIGFRIIDPNLPEFVGVCDSAGVETVRSTGTQVGAADHRLRIEISGNGTVVKFFFDGVQVGADVTTNIPTTTAMAIHVFNRSSTAGHAVHISDLFAWREV